MDHLAVLSLFSQKKQKRWHLAYWLVATALMFLVFSNRNYDLQIRMVLVAILTTASYFTAKAVNQYLIPQLLFKGKTLTFTYLLFYLFIITFWLNLLLILIIQLYSLYQLPEETEIPKLSDVLILITGHYLIVMLAAVIYFVQASFNQSVESKKLALQKQILSANLKDAQTKLLQGQIHPHFIFNMLNNLYGLVKKDPDKSREVIIRMSDLLEYMLYKCNKELVLLKDEIQFIENYIELERVRHDDDFKVATTFPTKLKNERIPPLLLFPFVENAFKHGHFSKEAEGIAIELSIKDQKIIYKVKNGIPAIHPAQPLKKETNGIGLSNVKDRLNLLYTDKYNLEIHPDPTAFSIHLEIIIENE